MPLPGRAVTAWRWGLLLSALGLLAICGLGADQLLGQERAPASKPASKPATRPAASQPAVARVVSILDSAGIWRALHSWNAPLVKTEGPEGVKESRGKEIWNFMTVYPPAGWTAADFDDSGWCRQQFLARYVNGETDERAGGGSATPNLRQLNVRGKFMVADPAAVKSLWLNLEYRGGAAVHVNGRELERQHLPEGKLENGGPGEMYPIKVYLKDDGKVWNWFGDSKAIAEAGIYNLRIRKLERLDVPAGMLRKGLNVLSIEIHAAPYPDMTKDNPKARQEFAWGTCGLISVALQADAGEGLAPNVDRPKGVQVWNTSLTEQIQDPLWSDPNETLKPVTLAAPRNGCASGRVMVSSDSALRGVSATLSPLSSPAGQKLPAGAVQVSYGRLGENLSTGQRDDALCEEPLAEAPAKVRPPPYNSADAAARKAREAIGLPGVLSGGAYQSVLVTARVPKDAVAGLYRGTLTIKADGLAAPAEAPVELRVADWAVPDPKDFAYWYGLIQSPEGVALRYQVPAWSDEHLKLMARSFKLIGQLGPRVLFIPLTAETEYGNEHSMVTWIPEPAGASAPATGPASQFSAGRYSHDFSAVEKYVDVAVKNLPAKPRYVVVGVWQWAEENSPPRITIRAADGQLANVAGPLHGTPESLEFWRPVLTKVRAILAQRGLAEAMLLGHGADRYPSKAAATAWQEILPEVGWQASLHAPNSSEYVQYEGGKLPLVYQSNVWGHWTNQDPEAARVYGWNFKYPISGGLRTWLDRGVYDPDALSVFRCVCEQVLLANRPGLGQIGADFWPHKTKDGKGWEATFSRFPRTANVGAGNRGCTTNQLLYPGPAGPAPSLRYELVRENIQECEARIFLEKLLTAKPAALPEDLAKQCQAVLDERTRWHRLGFSMNGPDMRLSWPYMGWQERSYKLHEAAGQAAKAVAASQPGK